MENTAAAAADDAPTRPAVGSSSRMYFHGVPARAAGVHTTDTASSETLNRLMPTFSVVVSSRDTGLAQGRASATMQLLGFGGSSRSRANSAAGRAASVVEATNDTNETVVSRAAHKDPAPAVAPLSSFLSELGVVTGDVIAARAPAAVSSHCEPAAVEATVASSSASSTSSSTIHVLQKSPGLFATTADLASSASAMAVSPAAISQWLDAHNDDASAAVDGSKSIARALVDALGDSARQTAAVSSSTAAAVGAVSDHTDSAVELRSSSSSSSNSSRPSEGESVVSLLRSLNSSLHDAVSTGPTPSDRAAAMTTLQPIPALDSDPAVAVSGFATVNASAGVSRTRARTPGRRVTIVEPSGTTPEQAAKTPSRPAATTAAAAPAVDGFVVSPDGAFNSGEAVDSNSPRKLSASGSACGSDEEGAAKPPPAARRRKLVPVVPPTYSDDVSYSAVSDPQRYHALAPGHASASSSAASVQFGAVERASATQPKHQTLQQQQLNPLEASLSRIRRTLSPVRTGGGGHGVQALVPRSRAGELAAAAAPPASLTLVEGGLSLSSDYGSSSSSRAAASSLSSSSSASAPSAYLPLAVQAELGRPSASLSLAASYGLVEKREIPGSSAAADALALAANSLAVTGRLPGEPAPKQLQPDRSALLASAAGPSRGRGGGSSRGIGSPTSEAPLHSVSINNDSGGLVVTPPPSARSRSASRPRTYSSIHAANISSNDGNSHSAVGAGSGGGGGFMSPPLSPTSRRLQALHHREVRGSYHPEDREGFGAVSSSAAATALARGRLATRRPSSFGAAAATALVSNTAAAPPAPDASVAVPQAWRPGGGSLLAGRKAAAASRLRVQTAVTPFKPPHQQLSSDAAEAAGGQREDKSVDYLAMRRAERAASASASARKQSRSLSRGAPASPLASDSNAAVATGAALATPRRPTAASSSAAAATLVSILKTPVRPQPSSSAADDGEAAGALSSPSDPAAQVRATPSVRGRKSTAASAAAAPIVSAGNQLPAVSIAEAVSALASAVATATASKAASRSSAKKRRAQSAGPTIASPSSSSASAAEEAYAVTARKAGLAMAKLSSSSSSSFSSSSSSSSSSASSSSSSAFVDSFNGKDGVADQQPTKSASSAILGSMRRRDPLSEALAVAPAILRGRPLLQPLEASDVPPVSATRVTSLALKHPPDLLRAALDMPPTELTLWLETQVRAEDCHRSHLRIRA